MSEVKISRESKVTLVSSDGDKFEVEARTAAFSDLVKTMMTEIDSEEEEEEEEEGQVIPLANVTSVILAKVIEFCEYHANNGPMKEIEKPLKSTNLAEVVGHWDADFVDIEQPVLFELILAANYMDIKSLLDLTCAKVGSMIKDKTPDQIKATFNIVNDFTPEEEAQARTENKWCEED